MSQYEARNTTVLGISFDAPQANRRFAEKFDFPFALLTDADRSIALAYGAADSPRDAYARRIAYLIDEEGRIAEAHASVDATTYARTQLESL